MRTALSSLEPFEGPCGKAILSLELDTHTLAMLDRLCRHYNHTRSQVVDEALERAYVLDTMNLSDPLREAWDVELLAKLSRVVALWEAGHLRTFMYVPENVLRPGTRRPGWHFGRHHLEKGLYSE
jgi:hypothetical protein